MKGRVLEACTCRDIRAQNKSTKTAVNVRPHPDALTVHTQSQLTQASVSSQNRNCVVYRHIVSTSQSLFIGNEY